MKCLVNWMWVNVAVAGMLCIPRMAAADGRITFTGAIVEATCTASIDADTLMPGGHTATPHRFQCGATQTAAGSGRFYSLTVVNLDAATIDDDRVLNYFAGYMKVADGNEATAKLVTQTFE